MNDVRPVERSALPELAIRPQRPASEPATPTGDVDAPPVFEVRNLTIRYGDHAAIRNVSLTIPRRQVTAIIGPSGCGKSTLLRGLNRMNDFITGVSVSGEIVYHGRNIYDRGCDPVDLRRKVGMVFQKPNPFPKSIFRNVAWGASINGYRGNLPQLVEESLKKAALWDEVSGKLRQSALRLSGGQQQRLCIARAIALAPEVLLMDEPCSALDPIATAKIENLIDELKSQYTVVIVTHNMQQAARVSDRTAYLYMGELVEYDETAAIFQNPKDKRTHDYIRGRIG